MHIIHTDENLFCLLFPDPDPLAKLEDGIGMGMVQGQSAVYCQGIVYQQGSSGNALQWQVFFDDQNAGSTPPGARQLRQWPGRLVEQGSGVRISGIQIKA